MMSRHAHHPRLVAVALVASLTVWLVLLDVIWAGVAR